MLDPQESDIGRKVIYLVGHGPIEEGVLVSFNSAYVFVRYGSDIGVKATRREDCEWLGQGRPVPMHGSGPDDQ